MIDSTGMINDRRLKQCLFTRLAVFLFLRIMSIHTAWLYLLRQQYRIGTATKPNKTYKIDVNVLEVLNLTFILRKVIIV